ncbi:hypothetical protein HCN44_000164 [Aphidius gifuensis]|uniref:Venom protein n=1 Tax=Aphidius gifuensis TaxID=684658 RepID=A0A835CN15_APHGI|nr:putative uncharacterized protein DDB_G0282133 [Aphidius gifuensis]KAF7990359.1 hypothetical protein HCN44_000164 [Aphidius gifuensis]
MSKNFFKKIILIIVFLFLISLSCAKEVSIEETDVSNDNEHYKMTDKFNDIIGKLTNKNLERLMNYGGVLKTRLYDINGMLIYQDDEHLSKFRITEVTPKNYKDKELRRDSDTFNVIMKDLSPFELESSEEQISNEVKRRFISKKPEIKMNNAMKNNNCNNMNCNSDDKSSCCPNNSDNLQKQIDDRSSKNIDSETEEISDDSSLQQEEINKPTKCQKCSCIDNCYNGCNDKVKKNNCQGNKCKVLNTDARKNINDNDISKEKKIDEDKTSELDESTQKDLIKKSIKYYKIKGVNASIGYDDDDNDTKVQSSSTLLNDKNIGKRRYTMSLNSLLTLLDADKKNIRKNIQNNEFSIEKKTKVKLNSSELSGRGNSYEDIDLTRKNKKFKEPQVSSRHITKDQKINENVAGVILPPQFNITENGQDQNIKIHDKENSSFNEDKIEFSRRSDTKLYTISSNNNHSVDLKILNDSHYEDYKNNFDNDDLKIDKPANRMFGFDTPIIGIKTDLSPNKIQSGKILSLKNNLIGKTSTESSNNKETATESLDKKLLNINKNSDIDNTNIEEHENEDTPKNRLFGLSTFFDEPSQRVTYKKRRTSNDMKTSALPLKLNSKEITTEALNTKISKITKNKSNDLSSSETLKLERTPTTTVSSITEPMNATKNPANKTLNSSTNNNVTTELNNAETTTTTTIINSLNSTTKIDNSTAVVTKK